VLPYRREMITDGKPIQLGGRAFDILMALIEARGAVVTKDVLMGGSSEVATGPACDQPIGYMP
jgi:DNA-binding winged helix-turn-helix (wHTH) protein